MNRTPKIIMVPAADARDFSYEVDEYCCDQEFSTHSDNGLHQLHLDGNPLQKFFEDLGHEFPVDEDFVYVGIIGT